MSGQPDRKSILWAYGLIALFLVFTAWSIATEQFVLLVVPLVLLVIMAAIFALDKLLLTVVFFTPLSMPLFEFVPGLDFNMFLPTEPILFGVLILFVFKILQGQGVDKKVLTHPISIAICFHLFWMLITSFGSEMPVVSFKFFLSRLWFIVAFYFIAIQLFRNPKNINRYIWLYTVSLTVIIGYTLFRHSSYGLFDQASANFVSQPFYNDHTAYGAALAMLFPVLVSFIFIKDYSYTKRMLALAFLVVISIAIVFSYTRATWVSMFVAAIFFVIILFRVKFRTIAIISISTIAALLLFWTQIWMDLERNRQDSSSNLSEQIESITNISTDASNMERLNRWNCAIRMWQERPLTGWGPGTYMFLYAPFQFSYEKTIISTNFGDLGNAHSEYLGPLAETGVPGTISVLVIFIMSIYYGMRVIRKTKNKNERILIIAVLVGLITYYVHGFLNNFLDTDKLSVLVWGYIAIIVVTDLAARKTDVPGPKKSENGIEKQAG